MGARRRFKMVIIVSQGILLLLTLIFYWIFRREYWNMDFWDGSMSLGQIVYAGFVIGVGIRLFGVALGHAWPAFEEVMEKTVLRAMRGIDFWDLLLISIPPAIIEELAFRGLLQPYLGIWVTSVIFATLHWGFIKELWAHGLHALLISLLLGWVYVATGSLLTTMIAHFVNNFLAGLYIQKRMIF